MTTHRTLTDDQLAYLTSVDSPTIANAIERFRVRPLTEGFVGGSVHFAFPGLGPMVGRALTVTMRNPCDRPASREGYWRMWEALDAMAGPVVLMIADVSGTPHRVAYAGEVMTRLARRLGAIGMVTDGALRDVARSARSDSTTSCGIRWSRTRTTRSRRSASRSNSTANVSKPVTWCTATPTASS